MKKLVHLFIGSFLFLQVCGQVISGTVVDKNMNEKVSYATIYFSGTFVGTISDINGNFTLDVSKYASMPLSVSCIGYYSQTVSRYSSTEPLTIFLEPKDFRLNEIMVSAKSLVRKRKSYLRLFKKEFLGSSVNALSCDILNEDDINFDYGSDDTLKVFAMKPILVRNKALGYLITYYLDKFEYYRNTKSFVYKGNIIFEENLPDGNKARQRACEERRKEAYLGSRMHFLRSLWAADLQRDGFQMADSTEKSLRYKDIVIKEAGNVQDENRQYMKYISYPLPITIYYNNKVSRMTLLNQRVYFNKIGFDLPGIFWEGEMLKKRVGDALPYEYDVNGR